MLTLTNNSDFINSTEHLFLASDYFKFICENIHVRDSMQKIEFYFTILDAAINSIEERFQQMEHLESVFGIILNMKDVKNEKSEVTVKACMKLEAA